MKKTLISIAAIAFIALMITSAYAQVVIPEPDFCGCPRPCGFTPGFWKHNIQVYLGETNGEYSAFSRDGGAGVRDYWFSEGTKLTDTIMENLLSDINFVYMTSLTFEQLLEALQGPGWSADRTNAANLFNWVAGYGPFED